MSIRFKSVQTKVTALIIVATLLPVVILFGALTLERGSLREKLGVELDRLTRDHLAAVSSDVASLCRAQHEAILANLEGNMKVAQETLQRSGGLNVADEAVSWDAVDQFTKAATGVELPKLCAGSEWLGQNRDPGSRTPVVDEVAGMVGNTCTIFQRMNDRGDMLRVATNVIGSDGRRAIGTYIPAVGSDGAPNPVNAAVLRGETYTGRAFVVDSWYITRYEPIRNDSREVIGMLYVGIKQENVPSLRKAILDRKIGETGYVFVLGGSGSHKGHYVVSKDGARDGENIWEAKDADGNLFIQEMVNAGSKLGMGQVSFQRYPWKNKGESSARYKMAAVTYFEPWDWVIGASAYEDEFLEANRKVDQAIGKLYAVFVVCGLIALAVVVFLSVHMIRKVVVRPVKALAVAADRLAVGDTDVQFAAQSSDEIGDLGRSMSGMAHNIRAQAEVADRIARGDLTAEVEVRSERDLLGKSMTSVVHTLRELIDELKSLTAAAVEGRLSTRGDAKRFSGGYREIVEGVNTTLDAVLTPIGEASEVLDRVARRDLSARVRGDYAGEHARIKESLNQAVENLDQGLQQVAVAVEQVASAAGQIGTGSQALAEGASEQASSLEEVSSALQEIASMTRQNAGNAKEARGLAEGTRGGARGGLEGMERLSDAVSRIKSSSDATARIVKTIDEIAFQTNLLALNAAVEAARAGDAGKGFAVVAEEVRNLAMRSAEAAKNTANMIEESVRNAEAGVELNGEVLSRLREIATQADKVGDVMGEIALASEQQSQGIGQVTTAMEQMNQVTQTNAASSEESASAAEELSAQAEELRSLVSQFRLSRTEETRRVPSTQPAAALRPKLSVVKSARRPAKVDPESVIPFHDSDDEQRMKAF